MDESKSLRERTIARAIRSVLNRTFQDFEIIVVDDGSTDGTRAVVEGFGDPRIRYLHRDRNLGAAAARNTGIKAAHGGYLAKRLPRGSWRENIPCSR